MTVASRTGMVYRWAVVYVFHGRGMAEEGGRTTGLRNTKENSQRSRLGTM